jgi:dephospho-CoA kinase
MGESAPNGTGSTAKRPIVIGLTGGMGTGKSSVLETLASLGAQGIEADRVAREVMEPGGPAYAPVVAAFGPEVLGPDGRIDRQRLGARVFGKGGALAKLERIVHPVVEEALQMQVDASMAPVVVIEAIKLLEAGLDRTLCDQVWVTTCSRRQQFARLAASRGMSAEEVRRRLAAQMPAAEMAARADRVIDTGGTVAETGLLVLEAWSELGLPFPSPLTYPGTVADAEGIAAVLNSIVREGGWTMIDHSLTPAQEREFLSRLPQRARLTVAAVGKTIAGYQIVEPYAAPRGRAGSSTYTGAMDHVASMGSYVVAALRRAGLGRRMGEMTFRCARDAGFAKIVISIRADNSHAQAFYAALGFLPCGRLTSQALVDGRYVDVLLFEKFL